MIRYNQRCYVSERAQHKEGACDRQRYKSWTDGKIGDNPGLFLSWRRLPGEQIAGSVANKKTSLRLHKRGCKFIKT